jgi:NTP pyrophosphatase (non-canonical NTP hydrolase)
MALSLVLEAAEVLEHFQWKTPAEVEKHLVTQKDELAGELADTLYWILLMANDLEINIADAFNTKMDKNEAKYSVKKAKGNHKKYSELI